MCSLEFSPEVSGGTESNLGLIFTDARGRVVFLDSKVLTLLGHLEVGRLVGEPLHTIIQVTYDVVSDLLADIARAGVVQDRPLTVTRKDGQQIETLCTGIASYDDQRLFIGADLTLHDPQGAAIPRPATHDDVLNVRLQQIEAEAPPQVSQDALLAQLYFTGLMSAVYVLLARTGGQKVSDAMEGIVNKRAAQSSWPIKLAEGSFIITADEFPPEAYPTLIHEVINYARNVIGGRVLLQEMHALDAQMKPSARDVASQYGMRDWAG